MTDFEPVLTDAGYELRRDGQTIYGPADGYSHPPRGDIAEAAIDASDVDESLKALLRLLVGDVPVKDERGVDS